MHPPPPPKRSRFRRLHPLSILVEVLQFILRFLYVLLLFLFLSARGSSEDNTELILTAFGAVAIFQAVARYYFTKYIISPTSFVLYTGVIYRQTRTVPLERIQNVEVKQTFWHQLFGLAVVRLETAGARAEVELNALALQDAQELKRELLHHISGTPASEEPAPPPKPLWQAKTRDLLLMGATDHQGGLVVGGMASLWFFIAEITGEGERLAEGLASHLVEVPTLSLATRIGIGLALILFFALTGWGVSIINHLLMYYDFTIFKGDQQFTTQHGLLTRLENLIRVGRVQSLRFESPFLRRMLGLTSVFVETASSFGDQYKSARAPLFPLISEREVHWLCQGIFPTFQYSALSWQRVGKGSLRRGFFLALLACLAFILLTIAFLWSTGRDSLIFQASVWELGIALPFCALFSYLRYRSLGWTHQDGFWVIRTGILKRCIWVVPEGKIQGVVVTQSPGQRRLKLASLTVITAGVGPRGFSHPAIPDLPEEKAFALQEVLTSRAEETGAWLPDAV
jgi:putative membrane protein